MIDWTELKSVLIAVLLAALGFLGAAYWRVSSAREKTTEAEAARKVSVAERLQELEAQMRLLGLAVQPITAAMSAVLVKQLTHYHKPELDALLVKVGPPNMLSRDEEMRLAALLDERTRDMAAEITDSERNAAQLLPLIIERSRLEGGGGHLDLALVGIPKAHE